MQKRPVLPILACVVLAALVTAACGRTRKNIPDEVLVRQRDQRVAESRVESSAALAGLLERTAESTGADRPLDILIVSGGGDFGAFGAGVLNGWSRAQASIPMPSFDVVSGVSTGALIAPFAFLGSADDLALLESLYRNPRQDWIRTRGLLFFMPDNESFAELPGLERELKAAVDRTRIERIAAQGESGRRLYVNTTDLDVGMARPFELTDAATQALADGGIARFHNILLASAGIPGAFPPREIDGILYVDGGVSSNILYGAWSTREQTFAYQFRQRYPALPKPKLRYWVILNNQVLTPPETVQPGWLSVIQRSVDVAIRSSTITSLRHLMTFAEVMTLRGDADVEVRWIAIPDEWRPPVKGVFRRETMNDLADLGGRMGADVSNWKTIAP